MADCSNACLFEAAVASGGGVERQVGDACGRDGGPAGPQVSETREASASGWACTTAREWIRLIGALEERWSLEGVSLLLGLLLGL